MAHRLGSRGQRRHRPGARRAGRAVVDAALEAAPIGQGRGSGAPGFSVAVEHDDCSSFTYAVGRRSLETGAPNQVSTRQHGGRPRTGP